MAEPISPELLKDPCVKVLKNNPALRKRWLESTKRFVDISKLVVELAEAEEGD